MSTPESPLSPEILDELLSAEIDGELASAARDLGLTLDDATAALAADPGADRRREALRRARELLAAPAPLNPSVELRLVATAIDRSTRERHARRARPRRARQALTAVGSVAAAVAVIAGVLVLAANNRGESSKASSPLTQQPAAATTTHGAAKQPRSGFAFGDVSNPRTLGAEVEAQLAVSTAPRYAALTPSPTGLTGAAGGTAAFGPQGPSAVDGPVGAAGLIPAAPKGATGPTGPQITEDPFGIAAPKGVQGVQGDEGIQGAAGPSGEQSTLKAASDQVANAVNRAETEQVCVAAIRRRAQLVSAPALSGTGTDAGREAVVVAFPRGPGYVVYVLAAADCTLLSQQTLP